MGVIEVILIGISLAMDSFAVTISNQFAYPDKSKAKAMLMPIIFGLFQGAMPLFGFIFAALVVPEIHQYAGIITFIILGIIGGKMIWDAVKGDDDEEEEKSSKKLSIPTLLFQGVATSIDALFVGVSFMALGAEPISSSIIIGITTFICVFIALIIGKRFGRILGDRAAIAGGIMLILIGAKSLFF